MPFDVGGDIPFPSAQSQEYLRPEAQEFPYTRWWRTREYHWNTGIVQMPVSGPPGTEAVFVQTSAPWGTLTIRYHVERLGAEPELPSPVSTDANVVLLNASVVPTDVIQSEGSLLFGAEGRYEYGLRTPVTQAEGFPFDVPPFLTGLPASRLGPEDFSGVGIVG